MVNVLFDEIDMVLDGGWDRDLDDAVPAAGGDAERYIVNDENGGSGSYAYC